MTAKNFRTALTKVLVHEGGYVNHPKDPGGATNQGITQRTYDAYRKSKGYPTQSVRYLTAAERDEIYRKQYWDAIRGDELPDGIDYVVFDGAVNSGPKQSIKWFQRALQPTYRGAIDGVIGMGTLTAVNEIANHDAIIDRMLDRRLNFLQALKTWPTFRKGWESRIAAVRKLGKMWARDGIEKVAKEPVIANPTPKAYVEDAKAPPSTAPADGAIAAGGTGAVLSQVQDQLSPYGYIEWVAQIIVVVTLVSVVVAAGGIAYRFYVKRKTEKLADAIDAD